MIDGETGMPRLSILDKQPDHRLMPFRRNHAAIHRRPMQLSSGAKIWPMCMLGRPWLGGVSIRPAPMSASLHSRKKRGKECAFDGKNSGESLFLHRNSNELRHIFINFLNIYMKKTIFSLLLLSILTLTLSAQTLKPLPNGKYPTSATNAETSGYVPVPAKISCVVSESSQDAMTLQMMTNSETFGSTDFMRMSGNVFVEAASKTALSENPSGFVVLQPNNVMEVYFVDMKSSTPKFDRVIAVAEQGAKFGDLKKTAKEHADAFNIVATKAAIVKANEAAKQKAIQEEAAAKAAAAKAAEEKRIANEKAAADRAAADKAAADKAKAETQNADLCTPLNRYFKMAPTNFKEIKGAKNVQQSEDEEEEIFNTSEKLPLMRNGLIIPTWKEGVSKVQFYSTFSSEGEADAHLAFVKSKLDPCYKNKGGFTYNLDSGIHFYKSAAVSMELMRSTDNTVYKVLIQITRK
jgi:hypothetical protein